MNKKELNELKNKSLQELDAALKNKKNELFTLRFQLATGQLQNTAAISAVKHDIARVKTIISQREKAQA